MSMKHLLEASVGDELLYSHHENGNRADPFAVVRVTLPLAVLCFQSQHEGRTACDRGPCGLRTLSIGRCVWSEARIFIHFLTILYSLPAV